jgi:hypothetical protein
MPVGVEVDASSTVQGHGRLHIAEGIVLTAFEPARAGSPSLADYLLTSDTAVLAVDEELRILRALPSAAALLTKESLLTIVDGALRHERARVQARLTLAVYDAFTSGRQASLVLPGVRGAAFHIGITPGSASDGGSLARQAILRVERRHIFNRPAVMTLQTVFGVSRAESRVLRESLLPATP